MNNQSVNKLKVINDSIENFTSESKPNIICVSKTFPLRALEALIKSGHYHYGENKVQEALDKWGKIKLERPELVLHLIGKLQTNKVKFALKIFDFIHSVDSKKLANKIYDEQLKQNKKVKIFIQVNLGNEVQKSGVLKNDLNELYLYCVSLKLNVVGLMCIPPVNLDPDPFFRELNELNKNLSLKDLSIGMSSDYIKAVENHATYLRVGSAIFGNRT